MAGSAALGDGAGARVAMALHHPPLALGLPNMDEIALAPLWAEAHWDAIAARPRPSFADTCTALSTGSGETFRFTSSAPSITKVAYAPMRSPQLMFPDAPPALSDIRLEGGDLVIHTRELAPDRRRHPS